MNHCAQTHGGAAFQARTGITLQLVPGHCIPSTTDITCKCNKFCHFANTSRNRQTQTPDSNIPNRHPQKAFIRKYNYSIPESTRTCPTGTLENPTHPDYFDRRARPHSPPHCYRPKMLRAVRAASIEKCCRSIRRIKALFHKSRLYEIAFQPSFSARPP